MAIFASYPFNGRPKLVLLAFTTLHEETEFTAAIHKKTIHDTLTLFGKTFENVCCLVSDNCNTMTCLADLCGVPFIGMRCSSSIVFVHFEGCAAHRFNLAVQFLLQDHSQLMTRVHEFMSELRSPKNCGMHSAILSFVLLLCDYFLTANVLIQ